MFWRRATGHGAFAGLVGGTAAAAVTHGLTLAEGKGGWIAATHTFPSSMAQNFWIAIFAWSACFLVTIAVSVATAPQAESDLRGLVYGLTDVPSEAGVAWYRRPMPLALVSAGACLLLNVWFW
jgi:SSS family solute:Na+ symporter